MKLSIAAFGRTVSDQQENTQTRTPDELRAIASHLRSIGFYKEAKDYEFRANRAERQRKKHLSKDYDKALLQQRKQGARDFAIGIAANIKRVAMVPHIADRPKTPVVKCNRMEKLDNSEMLPQSMIKHLQSDRNAAWAFHKHGVGA